MKTSSACPEGIATYCLPSPCTSRDSRRSAARLEAPQQAALLGIEREERSAIGAEHQPAGSGHQPCVRGRVQPVLPTQLAGCDLERAHGAVRLLVLILPLSAAVEKGARPCNRLALVIRLPPSPSHSRNRDLSSGCKWSCTSSTPRQGSARSALPSTVGVGVRQPHRPARFVQTIRPGLLHIRLARDEFPVVRSSA